MKILYGFAFSLFLLAPGCATLFGPGIPTDPVERLRYDIDAVLADSAFLSTVPSVRIIDPATGDVLYDRNSNLYIRPASNMKLVTSGAALHILGPGYRFATSVSLDPFFDDETVDGNITLKGYGDPDLTTRDLDSLAAMVAATGVRRITGDVVVDASFLDSLEWGIGWMWDDQPSPYQAFISALSVNKNCVWVSAEYDTSTKSVRVSTEPATSYVTLVNEATVAWDSVTTPLSFARPSTLPLNTIVATGQTIPGRPARREQLTVVHPDLYAGTLFKEGLERQGIVIDGDVRRGRIPAGAGERFWLTRGIDSVIINLNKVSDNLSAETTLKTLSSTLFSPPGTLRGGRSAINGYLAASGIDTTRHLIADGSGLSHYTLLRVDFITDILLAMNKRRDIFPLFYESLPIAGVDGTLRSRMRGTRAEGNVRAKTGTISGVSSLSGYVTTRDGEMLVFGMTMQDFIGGSTTYRRAQDRICELMAEFSRGRRVAERTGEGNRN